VRPPNGRRSRDVKAWSVLAVGAALGLPFGAAASSTPVPAPSFAAAKTFATAGAPMSVNVGDVNRDGKTDLVSANFLANTVSVLVNDGRGRFKRHREYRTGRRPTTVEHLVDLNGDGAPELVNADQPRSPLGDPDTISVLLNNGEGAFRAHAEYAARFGWSLFRDLDGDARPDLVTVTASGISIRLNRGNGAFAEATRYPSRCCVSAAADVNGDKSADLLGAGDGRVVVLLNRGDGTFGAPREYRAGVDAGSVHIADLNADGRPDAVTVNKGDSTVSVLLNSGNGAFAAKTDYRTYKSYLLLPDGIGIGDLNHDGAPDLTVGSYNVGTGKESEAGAVLVLINRGDATFGPGRSYNVSGSEWPSLRDLSGDGVLDIVYADQLLVGKGNGMFEAPLEYNHLSLMSRLEFSDRSPLGDLNGDGRLDLAWASWPRKTVSIRLNTPGLCNVQRLRGLTLAAAKRKLTRVNCRVGKVGRRSSSLRAGRVISQKPVFGAVRPDGAKVDLVISRGRRR
jgi:VCBS repeat protein/PASTA domain-containing protein